MAIKIYANWEILRGQSSAKLKIHKKSKKMYEKYTYTKWSTKTRKYYENKGYKYTKYNENFKVKVDDLKQNSNVYIISICDKCKRKKKIKFQSYSKCTKNKTIPYYCSICSLERQQKTNLEKYGYESILQDKIRMKKAMLSKYGYDNPSRNPLWKENYKKICQEKFGVDNVFQLTQIKEKIKRTNINKYGKEYIMQNEYYKQKYLIGANNHEWKGGCNRERPENIKLWRKEVFKKDNYTCQCCHTKHTNKDNSLVAHHLNAYKSFPDQRLDIKNGITLCENCHRKFHQKYGFDGNNTKEQFYEFLRSQETIEQIDENQ